MPFTDPTTQISADDVIGGTFKDGYTLDGSLQIGLGLLRAGLADDNRVLMDSLGVRLIRRNADGSETVTVHLNTNNGAGKFIGDILASTITGSLIRGGASNATRVEFDDGGIRLIRRNADGTETVTARFNTASGILEASGGSFGGTFTGPVTGDVTGTLRGDHASGNLAGTLPVTGLLRGGSGTGNRVEYDGAGIRLIRRNADGSDTVTVNLRTSDGNGTFIGTVAGSLIEGGTIRSANIETEVTNPRAYLSPSTSTNLGTNYKIADGWIWTDGAGAVMGYIGRREDDTGAIMHWEIGRPAGGKIDIRGAVHVNATPLVDLFIFKSPFGSGVQQLASGLALADNPFHLRTAGDGFHRIRYQAAGDVGVWNENTGIDLRTHGGNGGAEATVIQFRSDFITAHRSLRAANNGAQIVWRRDSGALSWDQAVAVIENVEVPRIAFHQPGQVASQIGQSQNSENIRTFNNPGTGYANFECGVLHSGDIDMRNHWQRFGNGLVSHAARDNGAGYHWHSFQWGGSYVIRDNNDLRDTYGKFVHGHGFVTLSDIAEKHSIADLPGGALDRVRTVPARQFKMNADPTDGPMHTGFIADELESVGLASRSQGFASDNPDGAKTYNLTAIVATLWKSVQELSDEVIALRTQLTVHAAQRAHTIGV